MKGEAPSSWRSWWARRADRGYVLEAGHVVLADEAQALVANPRVRSAYLGVGDAS